MLVRKSVKGGLRYPSYSTMEVKKDTICCKEWEEHTSQTVIYDKEGLNIDGCCGGGCYIITNIKFCPFCGKKLDIENAKIIEPKNEKEWAAWGDKKVMKENAKRARQYKKDLKSGKVASDMQKAVQAQAGLFTSVFLTAIVAGLLSNQKEDKKATKYNKDNK